MTPEWVRLHQQDDKMDGLVTLLESLADAMTKAELDMVTEYGKGRASGKADAYRDAASMVREAAGLLTMDEVAAVSASLPGGRYKA